MRCVVVLLTRDGPFWSVARRLWFFVMPSCWRNDQNVFPITDRECLRHMKSPHRSYCTAPPAVGTSQRLLVETVYSSTAASWRVVRGSIGDGPHGRPRHIHVFLQVEPVHRSHTEDRVSVTQTRSRRRCRPRRVAEIGVGSCSMTVVSCVETSCRTMKASSIGRAVAKPGTERQESAL